MPEAHALDRTGPDVVRELNDEAETLLDEIRTALRNGDLAVAAGLAGPLERTLSELTLADHDATAQYRIDFVCGCAYRELTGDRFCADHTHRGEPTADNPPAEYRYRNEVDDGR